MAHNRRMFGGRPGGPGGPVSPWEGGVVPGQGRPASAGILGAAPQPLNLLSQLSTPEAQLALASNLLTSLLGQQQQQTATMQQPRVPPGPQPLLSMNATAPGRGFFPRPDNMNKGGGPMRHQQRGHGNRFPDNYNKQRGDNRLRPNAPMNKRGGGSGGIQRNQRKSGGSTPNKSASERKTDSNKDSEKATDKEAKDESDVKKEDSEASKDDTKEEEDDEDAQEGKKRDWKDEKNKKDSAMDVEEEQDKDDKESGTKGGKGGSTKDGSSPTKGTTGNLDARYANVPKELLVCHICNKNMWDGQSFENHLRGKSHQMMMDQTEKTYKVQVKLMRQELKLAEEKREIEMERVQRLGKKVNIKSREYCTMCDLYFFGNIMGHRKNQLHQNLKNFLHPRCTLCSQEFPSRTEWDHHQLTPIHLVKLAESQKNEGKDSAEVAMVVEDEPAPADGEEKQTEGAEAATGETGGPAADGEAGAADVKAGTGAGGEAADAKAAGAAGGATGAAGAAGAKKPAGRQTVPPYDPKKSYGTHLLKKVLGYTCDVCNRFFFQHKEALAHCQTAPHYKNYAAYLMRTGAAAPPAAAQRPANKPADKAAAGAAPDKAADKNAEETPDGKRARKEGDDAAQGDGDSKGPAEGEADPPTGGESAQEQGADSTTESDDKGEAQDGAGDDAEEAQPGSGEPSANGVGGDEAGDGQDEGGDDGADEDEEAPAAAPDKAASGDDAMEADEDAAPAPASAAAAASASAASASASSSPSKADADKKYGGGGGQANRRGMGRGMGRGRGRGHRRSGSYTRQYY